ncbi:hypothetical protein D3C77_502440 [compost metagenome]
MTALIEIELPFDRHPAWCPEVTVIMQVVVATASIQRNVVITITSQAAKAGVAVESISSGRVGDEAEELFVT